MNSTVRLSFKVFFFHKVLAGPMNSVWDPLEKHNFAFSSCTVVMGSTSENVKHSSQKKKKEEKKKENMKHRRKYILAVSKHRLSI